MKKLKYISPRIKVTVNIEKREDLAGILKKINALDRFVDKDGSRGGVMIEFAQAEAGDQVPDITYQQAHGLAQ